MPNKENTQGLRVIKGGKLSQEEYAALPFPEKMERLHAVNSSEKMELILMDPEAERLAVALPPQDIFWTIKEVGLDDAMGLVKLASPDQFAFFLDMELWEKWNLSEEKFMEWLKILLECSDDKLAKLLPLLDFELLSLILMREITVGGGLGELATDDERLATWDHSFDQLFFITFRHKETSETIGRLLDVIYRLHNDLYLYLMESVRNEMESELEETAYALRSGRLADLGFPALMDALAIYAHTDPAAFTPSRRKEPLCKLEGQSMPVLPPQDSLFRRVLVAADSEELYVELNYLINNALVAEEAPFSDAEAMQEVMQRVHGTLNIAIEHLSKGNEAKGVEIVTGEYLKRLFQLGFSILVELKRKAAHITGEDYAVSKALNGLKARYPKFYKGLEPQGLDGYREFRDMEDVRKMEEFLDLLRQQQP